MLTSVKNGLLDFFFNFIHVSTFDHINMKVLYLVSKYCKLFRVEILRFRIMKILLFHLCDWFVTCLYDFIHVNTINGPFVLIL